MRGDTDQTGRRRRLALSACVLGVLLAGACGSSSPAPLMGGLAITAGGSHACALLVDHTVRCWGDDIYGELGDSVTGQLPHPQSSRPVAAAVLDPHQVAAGGGHTCAVSGDGSVWCWGDDTWGELGDGGGAPLNGLVGPVLTGAVSVAAIGPSADQRELAREYSCAVMVDGSVDCWGYGEDGEIGNGTNAGMVPTPTAVTGLSAAGAWSLALAGTGAYAVLNDGTVATWGTTVSAATNKAVPVPGLTKVLAIAAGEFHACAMLNDDTITCWGSNDSGQLGNGTTSTVIDPTPQPVPGIRHVMGIAAGDSHTCVAESDGTVWCWGADESGQLGNGGTGDAQTTPQLVAGVKNAIDVCAGAAFTCALLADTSIRCWGANDRGQLGNGGTSMGPGGAPSPVVEP